MGKLDSGEFQKTASLPLDTGLLSTQGTETLGSHLSLQAQDAFLLTGASKRNPGEPVLLAAAAGPEPSDTKRPPDPVLDRIGHLGFFTDPASGVNRKSELAEAQARFPDQASAPDVVGRMNTKLAASNSEYHLEIEPPSNARKPAQYQAMQIAIVDANGTIRDFLMIPPGR